MIFSNNKITFDNLPNISATELISIGVYWIHIGNIKETKEIARYDLISEVVWLFSKSGAKGININNPDSYLWARCKDIYEAMKWVYFQSIKRKVLIEKIIT